ncbi:acetyl-CoA carboxylase biotin carboxyl carrier protein [Elusimicrobiota bacterium]
MTNKKNNKTTSVKDKVGKLYEVMKDNDLQELTWEEKDFKLGIKREGSFAAVGPAVSASDSKKDEGAKSACYIRSPMHGVFYSSPSPSADPFVAEGEEVVSGSTVCVIEAMKLMNEVQVERNCKIIKVMAENATAVEVNQPIFEIENM